MPSEWVCAHCAEPQTNDRYCEACESPRFASWAIQIAEHVLEHISDGLADPLDVLKALKARPCYLKADLSLAFIAQQMRLLTKDTTTLARQIAKARAARTMLEVLEHGDMKDKTAILKGIQVLGDVVEHKGSVQTTVTHVYEQVPAPTEGS